MKLSAKARRFVAEAVADLPDAGSQATWRVFERAPGEDVAPDVAAEALRALESAKRDITLRLERGQLPPDEQADLGNDLRFIQSIESDLRKHCAHDDAAE